MIKARLGRDSSRSVKVLVLGSTQCGKSALVHRMVTGDSFLKEYKQTLGVDLLLKETTTGEGSSSVSIIVVLVYTTSLTPSFLFSTSCTQSEQGRS